MVRQVRRAVVRELHDAFRVSGRAGHVDRVGGAGQAGSQRRGGRETGEKSCKESHFPSSFVIHM